MSILDIDIETFSGVDLKKSNVYAYVEDPEFEVLFAHWSLDDGPIELAMGEKEILEIPGLFDPTVTKSAHNAGFERVCLSRMSGMPVGEYLSPDDWLDTMALAAEYGLPRGLDALAKALGAEPKDTAGTRLINLFCKPYRGRRVSPEEQAEKWLQFIEYGRQDVVTLQDVRHRLQDWPEDTIERALWITDQRVNDRGIKVDLAMARKAVEAAEQNAARAEARVIEITGVKNPNSVQQLTKWLTDVKGVYVKNLQAGTVKNLLAEHRDDAEVIEVLELRQELALVASRKYEAALRGCSVDGRLRGQFMFHAAHTGRWSSRGVQVHNLPRESDPQEDLKIAELVEYGMGATPESLKKLVRPMFRGPFVISDFSAIEARVLAWLAGEQWVLTAFEEGRDLYVETAERMGSGMGRPEGKIAVLAGGYQGSVGSLRNMGYGGQLCPFDTVKPRKRKNVYTGQETGSHDSGTTGAAIAEFAKRLAATEKQADIINGEAVKHFLEHRDPKSPMEPEAAIRGHITVMENDPNHKCDFQIKRIVEAYRDANPHIKQFWYDLEPMFWRGGRNAGTGKIRVEVSGKDRIIHLPSGRKMVYRDVWRREVEVVDPETGQRRSKKQLSYAHIQGYRDTTYGGRLTENVTQAVARDLLADAMLRLDQAGYYVVGHVHDEVIVESSDLQGIQDIMKTGPAWAEGLPLDASADLVERYTK